LQKPLWREGRFLLKELSINDSDLADTADFGLAAGPPLDRPRPPSARVEVDMAGLSDRGLVRSNNEDHFLTVRFGRYLETVETNLPTVDWFGREEEIGYALLVADGVGGHSAGEVASRMAITTLADLVLMTPDWILRLDDKAAMQEVIRRAEERYRQINKTLVQEAQENPFLHGFATTLTVAASLGSTLFLTHIGDSRAYLYRQGRLYRLTRDHTLAQELADRGIIAPDEVSTHAMRHMLTQVLGAEDHPVQPDVQQISLEDGDCVLLCTDGLNDMVADESIAAMLGASEPAAITCRQLIDHALEAGGKDNVTVAIARYRFPPAE
jgi:PPM family protein phosphatase